MKVLLINGSPHERGCTYTALRIVADALEEGGVETEIFHVGTEPIRGCLGCGGCARRGNHQVYLTGIQSTRRCVKRQQPTVLFLVHRFITALLRV